MKSLEPIHPRDVAASSAPLSPAIAFGDLVFVSGQVSRDAEGRVVGDTIESQTRVTLENLQRVLSAAGLTLDRVVRTNVYLTSIGDLPAMNEVYREFFAESHPARTTVEVSALASKEYLVEIDAIAVH